MKPVQAAIVGCGRISDLHELGYRGQDDACIVAVCDTKRARAREKAKAWGVEQVYTDYRELLANPDIDLVELLVPHHLHAEMAVTACRAGKHVSVQKPMALNLAEVDRMFEAAVQAGVILRVVEVIGDKGILFINRCTDRTLDLPPLRLFRDGVTREIPVERFEWHDSFIDCTRDLIQVLRGDGAPMLDGPTDKAVLQFALAAHVSAREGREVRPGEVQS